MLPKEEREGAKVVEAFNASIAADLHRIRLEYQRVDGKDTYKIHFLKMAVESITVPVAPATKAAAAKRSEVRVQEYEDGRAILPEQDGFTLHLS